MKTVTIGCPVRDRAWILPEYLEALLNIDYPKELISWKFVLNDSTDESEGILTGFFLQHGDEYDWRVEIIRANQNAPEDKRVIGTRDIIYRTLARVRNIFISDIETDYLFSVDSDIIVPKDSLKNLAGAEKDIIAGVIWNDGLFNSALDYPYRIPNLLYRDHGRIKHLREYPRDRVFEIDITGAVYLLSKKVCQNIKYGYHPLGEDIYFCNMARDKGYRIWVDPSVFCDHRMSE